MLRRLIFILTIGAIAGIVLAPLNPVNSKLLNLAYLGSVFGTWIGFTILTWERKPLRIFAFFLPVLSLMPFILPGTIIDAEMLRQEYVERLAKFEGVKYHWGGETSRGIDCSGLPRRAFREALLVYGIRNFNGRAFRSFAEN
jgi:hypothetical protein